MFNFPAKMLVSSSSVLLELDNKDITALAVPIDQYDSEDFNKNDFGYIRNDISQLARAQSTQEYDAIMKRLTVLRANGDVPKDMKPSDALKRVRSRYLQSPNELQQYAEQMASVDMDALDAAYRKALDSTPVAEPAAPAAPAASAVSSES